MSTLPYPKETIIAHVGGWELWRSRLPGTQSECTLWIGGHPEAKHGWKRLRSISTREYSNTSMEGKYSGQMMAQPRL